MKVELVASPWFWMLATLVAYVICLRLQRAWPYWFLAPILSASALLMLLVVAMDANYSDYRRGGDGWLLMLGPATVAMAAPIYQHRRLIQHHWRSLLLAVTVGSSVSVLSSWWLASLLALDQNTRISLLPRSISTPFAMPASAYLGGVPELTAVLVVLTGIFGALFGRWLLFWLPKSARIARGSAYGMAAHGVGTARAFEIGPVEGTVAALTMVLAGTLNVLLMPLLAWML